MLSCRRLHDECDGIVSVSNSVYEPEGVDALRRWMGDGRQVYAIGPLAPQELSAASKQHEVEGSENGRNIMEFLDKTLKSHGERSLIYVSYQWI